MATIDGREIAWLDWGAERPEPPIVCLHRAMESSHVWDQLGASLADRRRVIAPDLRGHGDSFWATPTSYGLADYRSDVAALLERLEAQWADTAGDGGARCGGGGGGGGGARRGVAVIGPGLGGLVACLLAGSMPEAVSHLVLVDAEMRMADGRAPALRERADQHGGLLQDYEAVEQATRAMFGAVDAETVTWILPYLYRRVEGGYLAKWDPQALTQAEGWNAEPWLARLRCPVLLVRGGEGSPLCPEVLAELGARIDDCRVVTLADVSEHAVLENSEQFEAVVSDFLLD